MSKAGFSFRASARERSRTCAGNLRLGGRAVASQIAVPPEYIWHFHRWPTSRPCGWVTVRSNALHLNRQMTAGVIATAGDYGRGGHHTGCTEARPKLRSNSFFVATSAVGNPSRPLMRLRSEEHTSELQ